MNIRLISEIYETLSNGEVIFLVVTTREEHVQLLKAREVLRKRVRKRVWVISEGFEVRLGHRGHLIVPKGEVNTPEGQQWLLSASKTMKVHYV